MFGTRMDSIGGAAGATPTLANRARWGPTPCCRRDDGARRERIRPPALPHSSASATADTAEVLSVAAAFRPQIDDSHKALYTPPAEDPPATYPRKITRTSIYAGPQLKSPPTSGRQRQHELSALSSQLKNRRQKKITSPHVARHAVQAMACAIRTTKEDDALPDCDMVPYKQVRAVARQKAGFARRPGRCWGSACRAGELHGLHPATSRALLGGCLDRDGSPGRRFYQRQ